MRRSPAAPTTSASCSFRRARATSRRRRRALLADKARGRAKIVALLVDPDDALLDRGRRRGRARHHPAARRRDAGARRRDPPALRPPVMKAIRSRRPQRCRRRRSPTRGMRRPHPVRRQGAAADAARCPAATASPSTGRRSPASKGASTSCCRAASRPTMSPRPSASPARAVVDVSSGVESRPGRKGPELIRRFLRAAKAAKQTA